MTELKDLLNAEGMRARLFLTIGCDLGGRTASLVLAAAQTIQVTPLAREGQIYVSFKLAEGLTDEVSEAIHSGLTITFSYDVDLKRSAAVWIDRTIASSTVAASVKYDTLTRRYSVTRAVRRANRQRREHRKRRRRRAAG